jgi:hypothetical protein
LFEKIPAAIIGLGRIASLLEKDGRREKPCTHAGAIAAGGLRIIEYLRSVRPWGR